MINFKIIAAEKIIWGSDRNYKRKKIEVTEEKIEIIKRIFNDEKVEG